MKHWRICALLLALLVLLCACGQDDAGEQNAQPAAPPGRAGGRRSCSV